MKWCVVPIFYSHFGNNIAEFNLQLGQFLSGTSIAIWIWDLTFYPTFWMNADITIYDTISCVECRHIWNETPKKGKRAEKKRGEKNEQNKHSNEWSRILSQNENVCKCGESPFFTFTLFCCRILSSVQNSEWIQWNAR